MEPQTSFSWNIVTKGFNAHGQVQQKVRSALSKLERHLEHFPSDAVHLQVVLEKRARKPEFTAGLVLRVPSNILRSTQVGSDPVSALGGAVKTLLRQLASLKSELRREVLWKRKGRRAELRASKALRFAVAPLASGTGLQNLGDVIGALREQNYTRLLRYVHRHLWHEARLNQRCRIGRLTLVPWRARLPGKPWPRRTGDRPKWDFSFSSICWRGGNWLAGAKRSGRRFRTPDLAP